MSWEENYDARAIFFCLKSQSPIEHFISSGPQDPGLDTLYVVQTRQSKVVKSRWNISRLSKYVDRLISRSPENVDFEPVEL